MELNNNIQNNQNNWIMRIIGDIEAIARSSTEQPV
jgi:hypothetical protein